MATHNLDIKGATTIHAFAGLQLAEGTKESSWEGLSHGHRQQLKRIYTKFDTVLIDEVSQLNGEYFEKVLYISQQFRPENPIQWILVGDFFQLPPVSRRGTPKYLFEYEFWSVLNLKVFELDQSDGTNFRQVKNI